jgi:hypothetical protein
MQDGGVAGGLAACVGVDQKLIVSTEDRVVQHRLMQPDLSPERARLLLDQ